MKKNYLNDWFKTLGTNIIIVNIFSFFGYIYVYLLYSSLKIKFKNFDAFNDAVKKGPVMLLFWHGRSLLVGPFWKTTYKQKYKASAIFSTHRDGIFMEKIMTRFKIGAIRGSSNENARSAAIAMARALKDNTSIALTIDGPTGPRFVIKALSPFYFSAKYQVPIFTFCWCGKNAKITKQWDRYVIPKFFSITTLSFSNPITVSPNLTDDEIEKLALKTEKEMLKQMHDVDAEYGFPPLPQQPRDLTKKNKEL